MKYLVFLIEDGGDGRVTSLPDWNGEETLEIRLAAFARDAVITIDPVYEKDKEE